MVTSTTGRLPADSRHAGDCARAQHEQRRAERTIRGPSRATLGGRRGALIEAKLTYFTPNRRFLGALMATAADPASPLSPFNASSEDVRAVDIAHFDRAIAETRTAVPSDLAPHLAKLLWFYQMGIVLFWIYDRSAGQQRTRKLLDASLNVLVGLIKVSRIPLLKPARRSVLKLVGILEGA